MGNLRLAAFNAGFYCSYKEGKLGKVFDLDEIAIGFYCSYKEGKPANSVLSKECASTVFIAPIRKGNQHHSKNFPPFLQFLLLL